LIILNIKYVGRGSITSNQVSLSSSSFLIGSPTFTLVGETSGGPPTTYTWTRDGVEITNSSSFSISLSLTRDDAMRYMDALYESTLTVRGRYPGVYEYGVTNRAATSTITNSITIEAGYFA
jgi:hypothetical protein